MPKRKTNKQTVDWKFIIMLIAILLIGLSVFALNQKLSYQSSAWFNLTSKGGNRSGEPTSSRKTEKAKSNECFDQCITDRSKTTKQCINECF